MRHNCNLSEMADSREVVKGHSLSKLYRIDATSASNSRVTGRRISERPRTGGDADAAIISGLQICYGKALAPYPGEVGPFAQAGQKGRPEPKTRFFRLWSSLRMRIRIPQEQLSEFGAGDCSA